MSTRRVIVVIAVAGVLVLGGCAPTPAPSPSPTVTPDASESPSAAPAPLEPPPVAELVLRVDGLGSLVLGEPAPEPSDPDAMIVFDEVACVFEDFGPAPGDPDAGAWLPIELYGAPEGGHLFAVGVSDAGVIDGVQVYGLDAIPTEAGIRVGSSVAELLAAYPSLTGPNTTSGISQFYLLDGPGGRIIFEVAIDDPELSGYWEPEFIDTVLGMTAVPTGTPGYTIAGSDGGIGGCPV